MQTDRDISFIGVSSLYQRLQNQRSKIPTNYSSFVLKKNGIVARSGRLSSFYILFLRSLAFK
jgi:hypothetical protein